jgi:hypothetical protein
VHAQMPAQHGYHDQRHDDIVRLRTSALTSGGPISRPHPVRNGASAVPFSAAPVSGRGFALLSQAGQ